MTLQTPFLTLVLGDFNAKSKSWYAHDRTNPEGAKIEFLTS